MIQWRLGAFTFHQKCAKCVNEVSRKHALSCSGMQTQLSVDFPNHYQRWSQSNSEITLLDQILNDLNHSFVNINSRKNKSPPDTRAGMEGIRKDITKVCSVINNIRSRVAGYVEREGKWLHPMFERKTRTIIYRQKPKITEARKMQAKARNRRVGRPKQTKIRPPVRTTTKKTYDKYSIVWNRQDQEENRHERKGPRGTAA